MINYIFEVSCCWLGFYLIYILWLSKETFFHANRWYLLTTLFLCLCLPFAEMPVSMAAQEELMYYFGTVTVGVLEAEEAIAKVVAQPVSSGWSVQTILIWLYIIGLLVSFFRFFYGLTQIYDQYRNGEKTKQEGYTLISSQQLHLPFSFF